MYIKIIKSVLFSIMLIIIFTTGCSDDINNQGTTGPLSNLTRSGKFIAFSSNITNNYSIFLAQVNTAGVLETNGLVYSSNPFNITNFNTADNIQSNWSPDGRMLVFCRKQGNQQEIYAFFFYPDGYPDSTISPNPKKLFSSNGNWDNNPSFSPDGAYLIWDRREDNASPSGIDSADSRDLFIGDISGSGNNFQVSNIRAIRHTTGDDEFNPKWSPRISVRRAAYEYQSSATSSDHDVFIIDPLDASNNQNFYNPNNSGYPAWAPECNRIIFESDKTSGNYWKIVSLPYPASGNPVDIVNESNINSRFPTWLPNGNLLAYIRYNGINGNIYIVNSGGGAAVKLLQSLPQFDAVNNLWPAW